MSSSDRAIFIASVALIVVILGGSLSFMLLEGFTFMDALWLTVITITTVGFGDIVPKSTMGRAIALLLVVSGISLFTYVLSNIFSSLVEGHLADLWGKRRMIKKIKGLTNHIIVCGAGRVGQEVVLELINHSPSFVVIEKDEQRLKELQELDVLFIQGDATEDKFLHMARIEYAKGIIVTLPDDTGNLFVTMSAKALNPDIKTITRANRPENVNKIKRAGANTVICPSSMAGSRMALSIIKPASVAYVQTLVETRHINLELEELVLSANSPLVNVQLKDSGIREKFGTLVLAIKRSDSTIVNPGPNEILLPGDIMILCGSEENLYDLEKLAIG